MPHVLNWPPATCLLILVVSSAAAFADPPTSATSAASAASPATQPADKSQYTLFNPTPEDLLRDMDTDRPNKTNTPHTIDAGHLQIETGLFDDTYNRDRYHADNALSNDLLLGQFNFRLGILNNLELNVILNSYDFSSFKDYVSGDSIRQNGVGDTIVGGKLNFWGNEMGETLWATALGIQPQLKIPTAREQIGNGHAELDVGLPFLMNLPDAFHLGLQTTVGWDRNFNADGDVTGWQNSISVDRVLIDNFDVYVEYWSMVTTEHHQEAQQTLDVGFTYPLNDNMQLDTGVNFGLNHASDSIEVTAGVTVRI
jgi:outer membrane putative beta-barrel porin/alpha-amylase